MSIYSMNTKNEFKYIGDDYLDLHDSLNSMNQMEQVVFNINNGGILIGQREMQYLIGGDKVLRASVEYLMGVNRVIKSDPEKYIKIFSGLDPRYPHAKMQHFDMETKKKPQTNSYIN